MKESPWINTITKIAILVGAIGSMPSLPPLRRWHH
jgi:hypothetical protein